MNFYIKHIVCSLMVGYTPLLAMHQEDPKPSQAEGLLEDELSSSDLFPMVEVAPENQSTLLIGARIITNTFKKNIAACSSGMHINLMPEKIQTVEFYYFPCLQSINFYYNFHEPQTHLVLDATQLPNLKHINFMGNKIRNFSLMHTPFNDLSSINLYQNCIEHTEFLQFAPHIEDCILTSNRVRFLNLGLATEFLYLKNLDLSHNALVSLEPLGWLSLPSLNRLDLTGNLLVSLKGIDKANMKALTALHIEKMGIHDVNPMITGAFTLSQCSVEIYTHQLCKLLPKPIPKVCMSNGNKATVRNNTSNHLRKAMMGYLR